VRRDPLQQVGQADNEEWRQRNEKSVAIGRNACPIRIKGNKKIESHHCCEKRDSDIGQTKHK
jgi:hypothetical protein